MCPDTDGNILKLYTNNHRIQACVSKYRCRFVGTQTNGIFNSTKISNTATLITTSTKECL